MNYLASPVKYAFFQQTPNLGVRDSWNKSLHGSDLDIPVCSPLAKL